VAITSADTDRCPPLAGHVGKQRCWERPVAVVGKNGVHRPVGDQVTTPGRRVQLIIGWVA
jgi:hypothetical protein